MIHVTELAKELSASVREIRGWAQDLHDDEWTEPIDERTGCIDPRTADAIRNAIASAPCGAPVAATPTTTDPEVIPNGTLVEIHAGTFRAFLGTVRGAQEIVPDGGTSWVAYSIERSNGRMETVTGDAVTVVPE